MPIASKLGRRYAWRPDLPDARDILYSAPHHVMRVLPHETDLRPGCPPVFDQSSLGSCSSQAIGALDEYVQKKQDPARAFQPSRLFIYFNERQMEGTVNEDAGAMIRDGTKSVAAQGVCPETMWEYDITRFRQPPPQECYTEALKHQAIQYSRVSQTLTQMQGCLAEGFPFVFGFTVYESFESDEVARTGIVPMPRSHESTLGGHAVMCCGYNDATQRFLVRNSWGLNWGIGGYFEMPYSYLTHRGLASDFWTIRQVE